MSQEERRHENQRIEADILSLPPPLLRIWAYWGRNLLWLVWLLLRAFFDLGVRAKFRAYGSTNHCSRIQNTWDEFTGDDSEPRRILGPTCRAKRERERGEDLRLVLPHEGMWQVSGTRLDTSDATSGAAGTLCGIGRVLSITRAREYSNRLHGPCSLSEAASATPGMRHGARPVFFFQSVFSISPAG